MKDSRRSSRTKNRDMREIAIARLIVHAVANDKNIRNFKSSIGYWQVDQSAPRLIEKGADIDASRFALVKGLRQVVRGEPCVDNVLDEQHVASGDTFFEIFRYAHNAGAGWIPVTGDSHEVYRARKSHRAKQIGGEDKRPFQYRNDCKVFAVIGF